MSPGTLYPLLMRLADEGLLETEWQASPHPGRPARHAYRLSLSGLSFVERTIRSFGEAYTGQIVAQT